MTQYVTYPTLPLRDSLIFPHMIATLFVGRSPSIDAVLASEEREDQLIFVVAQLEKDCNTPSAQDCHAIGTLVKILQVVKLPDESLKVVVEGVSRMRLMALESSPYFQADLMPFEEELLDPEKSSISFELLMERFEQYLSLIDDRPEGLDGLLKTITDVTVLVDVIAMHLSMNLEQKQDILAEEKVQDRLDLIFLAIHREVEWLKINRRLDEQVRKDLQSQQFEAFRLSRLKVLKRELGVKEQQEEIIDDFEKLSEDLNALDLDEEQREKVHQELKKLRMMPAMSAEATVIRSYLEWIALLPWRKSTPLNQDLAQAMQSLHEDHYGLEEVKERVLEHLAVQMRAPSSKGPLLCLVGPPGVGKTSLGASVAKAMGRSFVRIALGGVRDEAEIRGHRKTYIGAMPGRIIRALRQAGTDNALILLDEVDKMGQDFRGDPASALLEVLDPEQNQYFTDHYIEMPFDLSKVMFMLTANSTQIPEALMDRLELIRLPGYTEQEKITIARSHLLPKCLKSCALSEKQLTIPAITLQAIIRKYTREAGVRGLERAISKICRKVIKQYMIKKKEIKQIRIKPEHLSRGVNYLGVEMYQDDPLVRTGQVGLVHGLAWTSVGGDTLNIEVLVMPGKGKMVYTGNLGDVMGESIEAAWSVTKAHTLGLGLHTDFFLKHDVHVHVPEGATPKDGPSAGMAMCVAMVSAVMKQKVQPMMAMTGEVTLHGEILAIGGVKEKLLAAQRFGIKTVLLAKSNEKDVLALDKKLIASLNIHYVDEITQALHLALIASASQSQHQHSQEG